jgi:catechol 2,3-dioxygenase-like lactoylglutathione lyase family enzyme
MLKESMAYATLPASDLARARAFYENKLRLAPIDGGEVSGGVFFHLRDQVLFVYETAAPRGGNTALSFVVEDLDAEMRELRDRGIVFEDYDQPGLKTEDGVAEFEGMRVAWFKDSEGNILNLGQPTEEQLRMMADVLG